jgi:hypothetical protein
MKKSTGETIYTGTAKFGKIMALFALISAIILALVMIPLGIYFIVHKTKLTSNILGNVSISQCTSRVENNNIVYDCNITVDYKVEGKNYSLTATTSDSSEYKKGDSITVYYNPSNPSNAAIYSDNTHIAGIIILVIGIIIPVVTLVFWLLAKKYKAVAAAGGVAAGLDILSGGKVGTIL